MDKKIKSTKKLTKELIIKRGNKLHDGFYDYSLVEYINSRTKIKIVCPVHGVFEQTPDNHLNKKSRCPICTSHFDYKNNNFIIDKFNIIHNNKYNYSLVKYKNRNTNIKIICPNHGEFNQLPKHHMNGHGCPSCNESKGEKQIRNYLTNNNIKYESQKTFDNCINKRKLKFDFYLPEYNMIIEYDGQQHFEPFRFEKDDSKLKERIKNDNIKNTYCKEKNIKILRIPYNKNHIDDILNLNIKKFIYK